MATIKEIAKLANVSIATVSNVLNQKPGSASPEKVEKVLKVAKSLNYRPNYLAQSLKRQRSRSIGIIAEDLTVSQTAEIINGIEEYCEEYDYEALLANMRLFKRYGNNLSAIPERSVLFNRAFDNLVSKQVEAVFTLDIMAVRSPFLLRIPVCPLFIPIVFPRTKVTPMYFPMTKTQVWRSGGRLSPWAPAHRHYFRPCQQLQLTEASCRYSASVVRGIYSL